MTTKIKYRFVNDEVIKAESNDGIGAYIRQDRWREAMRNRRFHDKTKRVDYMFWDDMPFTSQWGNPEAELLEREIYDTLDILMECLTPVQRHRFRLILLEYSIAEIARQDKVSVQSAAESVAAIRTKLQKHLKHKFDE